MSPDLNVKALHSFSLRVGMSNQTQTGTSKRQHRDLSPELQSFSNSQTWLGRGGISWNCLSVNTLCKINFWCSVQSCLWSSCDSLQRQCVEPRVLICLSLAVSLRVHCWMQTCAWDFWDWRWEIGVTISHSLHVLAFQLVFWNATELQRQGIQQRLPTAAVCLKVWSLPSAGSSERRSCAFTPWQLW